MNTPQDSDAGGPTPRRLFVYNAGFLTQRRLRRILQLAGYRLRLGRPAETDQIGVWGQSPYAKRGEAMAERTGAPLVRVEDAFIRSLFPGREKEPPLGLMIDHAGVHFDGKTPSDLETLLATHPLDDSHLLNRARHCMEWMKRAHISKYSGFDPTTPAPAPGYVLVIDQTRGDASVLASKADRARFVEMLIIAQEQHPGARVVIKAHPETTAGHRPGHFGPEDETARVTLLTDPVSPWTLLEGAVSVYTVSSQLGFEAIFAGHKPHVFGQPFYSGWGLTVDDMPVPRRARNLSRAQLFAAAMILAPTWYDPYRDRLCELEDVLACVEAEARAWRDDHRGWVAEGIRLWKRQAFQQFFGSRRKVQFAKTPDAAEQSAQSLGRDHMVWAANAPDKSGAVRVEDGFVRSRGLGAELIPPLSLVCDRKGIYYDPREPSDLEQLIAQSPDLPAGALHRAQALIAQLTRDGISKYNTGSDLPELPTGTRILVPGQVSDDASIRYGAGEVSDNTALLQAVRAANPDAVILYKPHPDVLAGLRQGAVDAPQTWADVVLGEVDITQVLSAVDAVWTITSLTGFEALLRGVSVTTLGTPFYAGWGLTRDLGPVPQRRLQVHGVTLAGLAHAALIDYPRYYDPVTHRPCPPEVAAERLAARNGPKPGATLRLLSKLQGIFATQAHLWRR